MQISDSPVRLSVTVAAAVRAEMARQRVSQQQLAERLGWSQQKISRRLNGDVPFGLDELTEVAVAVDSSAADILTAGLSSRPVAA